MKLISLDIQKNFQPTLDISGFFEISEVHAIAGGFLKPTLDQILPELPTISLAKKVDLEVEKFETFETLDVIHPDVLKYNNFFKNYPRPQKISLISELKTPFSSLDIRSMKPIISERKYADFFTRKLPLPLRSRRFFRESQKFFYKNQKKIIYVFATILMIFLPMIWFIKFSVESGYNRLLLLREAKNFSEIKNSIQKSKQDFERANFFFAPFSWLPIETVDMVDRAIVGGQTLTRAMDDVLDIFPSDKDFSLKIVENGENNAFRGASKDIFPLENLGFSLPTNLLLEKKNIFLSAFSGFKNAGEIYKNTP